MSAAVEFDVDGSRYTMAAFLAANADDEGVCEWAASAQPGDFWPGVIPCTAVAAQGGVVSAPDRPDAADYAKAGSTS